MENQGVKKRKRRLNGSGTLLRRNGVYYGKLKVGGKEVKISLATRKYTEAVSRLDVLSKGFDLSDEERLAAIAVHLRPKTDNLSFADAWLGYSRAPENISQSDLARHNDCVMWECFLRWLHGCDDSDKRKNMKAHYIGAECLADISEKVACDFVMWLKDNFSPETANKYMRVLKRVWSLNGCSFNPWAKFKKFEVCAIQRRALTEDEVSLLINSATGELKTLFVIGAYTGMRMGDCQRLKWEMVTDDKIIIRTSKTKRLAAIPIHPKLREALGDRKISGYVLPGIAEWSAGRIGREVIAHFRKCGFEQPKKNESYKRSSALVGFHSLRSTFITRLGSAGIPLAVVREMVGHVSEDMSQRYFRIDGAMAQRAIAALS